MALKIFSILSTAILLIVLIISCSLMGRTPFPNELVKLTDYIDLSQYITEDDYNRDTMKLYTMEDKVFLYVQGKSTPDRIFSFDSELNLKAMGEYWADNLHLTTVSGDYLVGEALFDHSLSTVSSGSFYPTFENHQWGFSDSVYYYKIDTTGSPLNMSYDIYDNALALITSDTVALPDIVSSITSLAYDPTPSDGSDPKVCIIFRTHNDRALAFLLDVEKLRSGQYSILSSSDLSGDSVPLFLPDSDNYFYNYTGEGVITRNNRDTYHYRFDNTNVMLSGHPDSSSYSLIEVYDTNGEYWYRYSPDYHSLNKFKVWWK